MSTELVLLVGLFVFLLMGAFLGDGGPRVTFATSAPRLAARVERDLISGGRFQFKGRGKDTWFKEAGGR